MEEKKKSKEKELTEKDELNDLFEEFDTPPSLKPILKELGKEKVEEILTEISMSVTETTFSGPLPHPSTLKEYEKILPGAAERIFKTYENQSTGRINIEAKLTTSMVKLSERGQLFSFALTLICLTLGTVFTFSGFLVLAGTLFTSTILGLAAIFIGGKKAKTTEE